MRRDIQNFDSLRWHPRGRKPKLTNRFGDILRQVTRYLPGRRIVIPASGIGGTAKRRAAGQRLGVDLLAKAQYPRAAVDVCHRQAHLPGGDLGHCRQLGRGDRGLRRGHRLIRVTAWGGVEADHRVVMRDGAGLQLDHLDKRHRHRIRVFTAAA